MKAIDVLPLITVWLQVRVLYRKMMQSAGFRASMSRKADCYDNAPMESFFPYAQNRTRPSPELCNT
jgi:transposase InsO family protein